ncbi:hypothetical protein QFC24_006999 [Naganishia onofrii]|uniref:Uncharacterized protein n=1 Tax=Naganishia onofrii TaxID=1851511 RepID=A0ACC2WVZ9_9TREE|nr:hypothetical protein QFC24_006999 [Naganishia onofrii]
MSYIDAIICNKFYATVAVTIICKQYDEPGLSDLRNVLDIVFGKIRQAIRGVGTQHIGSITVGYPLNGKITEWGSIRPGWPTPEGKLEFFALEMRDGSMKDL